MKLSPFAGTKPTVTNILLFACAACVFMAFTKSACADPIVYANADFGSFGTLDLNTGVYAQIGIGANEVYGLGTDGGNLYSRTAHGPDATLFLINPLDGSQTPVGDGGVSNIDAFGSTTSGLFGTDYYPSLLNPFDLFAIDTTSGNSTFIGATGIADTTNNSGTGAISTGSSTLYLGYSEDGGSTAPVILYSLDTITGVATEIGNTGIPRMGALVFVDGVLYEATDALDGVIGNSIYTINTTTGQASFLTDITGLSNGEAIVGMAQVSGAPEPSTLVLFATGLIVAGALRLRARHSRKCLCLFSAN